MIMSMFAWTWVPPSAAVVSRGAVRITVQPSDRHRAVIQPRMWQAAGLPAASGPGLSIASAYWGLPGAGWWIRVTRAGSQDRALIASAEKCRIRAARPSWPPRAAAAASGAHRPAGGLGQADLDQAGIRAGGYPLGDAVEHGGVPAVLFGEDGDDLAAPVRVPQGQGQRFAGAGVQADAERRRDGRGDRDQVPARAARPGLRMPQAGAPGLVQVPGAGGRAGDGGGGGHEFTCFRGRRLDGAGDGGGRAAGHCQPGGRPPGR